MHALAPSLHIAALHDWIWFHAALLVLLAIEYGVVNKLLRHTRPRAVFATALWVAAALALGAVVLHWHGRLAATQYLAGYALEQSLSIDNLFVFLLLFAFFRIPEGRQQRVLFWGVAGAMVMRGAFIAGGLALLARFEWVSYLFAAILAVAAIRLFKPEDPEHSADAAPPRWLTWITRLQPVSARQDAFFVTESQDGKPARRMMTVLFLALLAVEFTDVIFALDSIPAVLSITRSPFLAYSSNIMAVMSLRSLYVLLAAMLERLRYLHYGLATILLFAAVKILIGHWLEIGPLLSLGVIAGVLAVTIAASLAAGPKARTRPPAQA